MIFPDKLGWVIWMICTFNVAAKRSKSSNSKIGGNQCSGLPSGADVRKALCLATMDDEECTETPDHGGFNLHMWATLVDRDGVVCEVAFTGNHRGDQWPGSRVISAQKANTANAFSLPGFALSSANLWEATRDQGNLADLVESNPVDTKVAYSGPSQHYGKFNDPMKGQKIGGVNIFGGGLALYDVDDDDKPVLVGGLGVSGDTSCEDHNIAWKMRETLVLDSVPGGPTTAFALGGERGDELIFNDVPNTFGFGHPHCHQDEDGLGYIKLTM